MKDAKTKSFFTSQSLFTSRRWLELKAEENRLRKRITKRLRTFVSEIGLERARRAAERTIEAARQFPAGSWARISLGEVGEEMLQIVTASEAAGCTTEHRADGFTVRLTEPASNKTRERSLSARARAKQLLDNSMGRSPRPLPEGSGQQAESSGAERRSAGEAN